MPHVGGDFFKRLLTANLPDTFAVDALQRVFQYVARNFLTGHLAVIASLRHSIPRKHRRS